LVPPVSISVAVESNLVILVSLGIGAVVLAVVSGAVLAGRPEEPVT
jgi:hypothetical protein